MNVHFKIITDCKVFILIMNKRNLRMRIASRNLALKKFNYEIEHRPRRSMLHIDKIISLEAMFLSRSTGRASF